MSSIAVRRSGTAAEAQAAGSDSRRASPIGWFATGFLGGVSVWWCRNRTNTINFPVPGARGWGWALGPRFCAAQLVNFV